MSDHHSFIQRQIITYMISRHFTSAFIYFKSLQRSLCNVYIIQHIVIVIKVKINMEAGLRLPNPKQLN